MSRLKGRIGVALALLGASLALGVSTPRQVAAAPNCQGPVTSPCVVVPGLVIEPVLRAFPGYPSIPVNFALAPDGKIFVADKSGQVLVYSGRGATQYQVVIDIRNKVHDFWDRGLLGIALDPQYGTPGNNFVYILYTLDRDPFGSATVPRWGGATGGDQCPDPPGGGGAGVNSGDGCVVTAQISRIPINTADGTAAGPEQVIFAPNAQRGWCSQYPSHSVGTLLFGPDGKLYAGVGDGASFDQPDWGQLGGQKPGTPIPPNPCNDPPGGRGGGLSAPTSEGGSLRSQSVLSTVNDGYQPLDGSIIRINKNGSIPDGTDGQPANPLAGGADGHGDDDAIVAFGMRNPFRFNFKPGTPTNAPELWLGDVGASTREEIDHATLGSNTVPNMGWPCHEGNIDNYDFAVNRTFNLCSHINGAVPGYAVTSPLVDPVVAYGHTSSYWDLNTDAGCKAVSSSDPGSAAVGGSFVTASDWPGALNGAYVFGDYGRQCLWALTTTQQYAGTDPELMAKNLTPLASGLAPVSVQTGPDGAIYALDIGDQTRTPGLYRIGTISSPIARFNASPSQGVPGQPVTFNGSTSFVRGGATITNYDWDWNGDGTFDTFGGTNPVATHTFSAGAYKVTLRVTDSSGLQNASAIQPDLQVGTPPVINGIATTIGASGYLEGDNIAYDIDATGNGPLVYTVNGQMRHCDTPTGGTSCHLHFNVTGNIPTNGAGQGSFLAPGHAGYSFVQLVVTVTDADGLTANRVFDLGANWLTVKVDTFPPGLHIARDGNDTGTPYSASQIGSPTMTITAPATQTRNGVTHLFTGWADQPASGPTRTFTPAAGTVNLTAQFAAADGLTSFAPVRVLDTRVGTGAPAAIVPSAGVVQLDLRAAGVPAVATGVLLNVTTTEGTAPGFVTVYPCSQPRPLASNLNYSAGQTVANLVQVAIDGGGQVCLYAHGATHLVADLSGWFEQTGKAFTPSSPTRVLDTRVGTGAPVGALAAGSSLELDLSSAVPAGATSAVLNVTSTESAGDGFVTAYPCGGERPLASNLNVRAGDVRPNQVVVALGAGNKVCLYAHATMHLVADLLGFYGSTGVKMATQSPERVMDTRDGTGGSARLDAAGTAVLDLSGQAPAGATGVVLNVTGVGPSTDSYVTVYPCGVERPLASNLNLTPNDIRPNLVTVPLGAAGKVCLFSQAPIDLVADVAGWAVAVA